MKIPYQKPVIQKLKTGYLNKFGASPFYHRTVRTEIDQVPVDKLVEDFGSPLFVYSEDKFRQKIHSLRNNFAHYYPNVTLSWSYKTNYLKSICAIAHQEGLGAEVVSEMEYDKARNLGVPGKDIIINGPHKPRSLIEKAAREGAILHIDHFDEINDIEAVSDELEMTIPVAIRVNMETGIQPQWSRFGFNLEAGQAIHAAKRIASGKKLRLIGLHAHIGTFILEPNAYAQTVEKLVKLSYEVEDQLNFVIEYIDIGGGFPSRNKLKGTYLPPDLSIPPIEDYAQAVSEAMFKNLRQGDTPKLILESGRFLIDEAGSLISTVFATKRLPDGRRGYVMDAGLNLLFTTFWYKFQIEMDREVQGMNEPSVLYGPLCMNIDVLEDHVMLPALDRGTRLIFSPVGAYNNTQWMQFIEYRPNIVLIGKDGTVDLIREREDLSDLERRELLPQRLELNHEKTS